MAAACGLLVESVPEGSRHRNIVRDAGPVDADAQDDRAFHLRIQGGLRIFRLYLSEERGALGGQTELGDVALAQYPAGARSASLRAGGKSGYS